MNSKVFIHVDAGGTYLGNGGLVSLLGLADILKTNYWVAIFDPHDRLNADKMAWAAYPIPRIAPAHEICSCTPDDIIVTTWLHGDMLPFLATFPRLWPYVRYWCTGELLREGHEASRQALLEHAPWIAVCNRDLIPVYTELGFDAVFDWTNWIRDLFRSNASVRIPNTLGYQPDQNGDEALDVLQARYGDRLILCTGSQRNVAAQMRRCDMFLAWNKKWPMVHGPGESFGLAAYEAMASGSVVVGRAHSGNRHWPAYIKRGNNLEEILDYIDLLFRWDSYRTECRRLQKEFIEEYYRFDKLRMIAIRQLFVWDRLTQHTREE